MYQLRLTQQTKPIQQLLREDPHKRCAQPSELVLLDQLVQIHRQQLKHKTQMLPVNESVLQPQNVVVIVLVHASIEQIQNRYLHHALIEVGRFVLDHFDSDDLLCFQILAFDYLPERALTEDVEDEVAVLVIRFFGAENIVYIEDVVAVFVVVAIVLHALARFGEDSSWVSRRLVLEGGVAYSVGGWKVCCESLEWTDEASFRVCSSKRWLCVDSWLHHADLADFGELGHARFRGSMYLLMLWSFWRLWFVAKHCIELLRGGLRVVAVGRHVRLEGW